MQRRLCCNGHCEGVIAENKSGSEYYSAKMFVDVSGDADLMRFAVIPAMPQLCTACRLDRDAAFSETEHYDDLHISVVNDKGTGEKVDVGHI